MIVKILDHKIDRMPGASVVFRAREYSQAAPSYPLVGSTGNLMSEGTQLETLR